MAAIMPTIMAVMPTAPPVPVGQSVTLSQSDLNGRWDGYLTFDSVKLTSGTAEEQKACDDQLALIKGRQLPSGMKFDPTASDSGDVTMINKETNAQGTTSETEGDTSPYTYKGGTLTINTSDAESTTVLEGKALRTDSGFAIVGTWNATTADLNVASTGAGDKKPAVISGTWIMRKAR